MASILQMEANRRNSQKSTGPRTTAGKATSSMNALKSGIDAKSQVIRGEDSHALDALKTSYYETLQPTSPQEAAFVDAIISADWLLRRLRKAEAEVWNREFARQEARAERYDQDEEEFPLAAGFEFCQHVFYRLQCRIESAERSLRRSTDALRRLRQDRPNPDPPPATLSTITTKPEIGFVPPTLPQPIPEAPLSGPWAPAPGPQPCLCVGKESAILPPALSCPR